LIGANLNGATPLSGADLSDADLKASLDSSSASIKSPNPSNPMKTQRESRRMVSRFAIMVAKFLHIPDWAAVYVIWAAWIAVVIIIGIIVMLWR
jgi:hypothetical protein